MDLLHYALLRSFYISKFSSSVQTTRIMWSNGRLIIFILLQLVVLCVSSIVDTDVLSRRKRLILFPPTTNVQLLIIGIGVPVEIQSNAVVLGWSFRGTYFLPSNLSQVMPMDLNERRKRSVSRWHIYKMLEQMSEMRGFGGRSCILRSICEASDVPIDKNNGFFEELFHSFFTPSTTNEGVSHHTDNEYYAAQNLGRDNKGQCKQLFPGCTQTFLDMFTRTDS